MSSGGQVYLSMEEIDLVLEAIEALEGDHAYDYNKKSELGVIKNKVTVIKARRLEMNRPLKFLKSYKDDTPLPFEIVTKGHGIEKYYEVLVDGKIRSPHGFYTYDDAVKWVKENL